MDTVLITMKSRQVTADDAEETELITIGTCQWEDTVLTLSYEDTDATGFAGATTTIRIDPDLLVSILRSGTANSNLTLETGKKHFCLYSTPFGEMTIGVQAKEILFEPEEMCGTLHMVYVIDINAVFMSENTIDLRWEVRADPVQAESV